jgi:AraC family transcriptional regulator
LPMERCGDRIDEQVIAAAFALRRVLLGCKAYEVTAVETVLADFVGRAVQAAHRQRCVSHANSLTSRRLAIVEDFIEAHLDQPISVGDMAASIGLSMGFFIRAFRAATGQTPHRYLMSRRLLRARNLLESKRTSVAEVACLAGFCSQAHMSAVFRRELGLPPATYRVALGRG